MEHPYILLHSINSRLINWFRWHVLTLSFSWIYPLKKLWEMLSSSLTMWMAFSSFHLDFPTLVKNAHILPSKGTKKDFHRPQKQNGQNQKNNKRYKNHAQSTFQSPLTIKHHPLITYLPKMHHHQGYFRQKNRWILKTNE